MEQSEGLDSRDTTEAHQSREVLDFILNFTENHYGIHNNLTFGPPKI